MVSNVLEIEQAALVKQLKAFKKKYASDPEFKRLRAALPKEWPF